MPRVLGVGIATLDIISLVERYPAEDDELRALSQRRVRGGNATNTLVVLAQLGHACAWAGVLPRGADSELVERDLARYGIDTSAVLRPARGSLPLSCILLNRATGSRTIVHYRDLPEYPASAFETLELAPFRWIHFEGRAVEELGSMLERAERHGVPTSLEVEKPRPGIEPLFSLAGVLLFSRAYARARGYEEAERFLEEAVPAGCTAWLAWGEGGGWCREPGGRIHHRPAPGVEVVDSVGAGDVFNAAVVHGHLQGWPAPRILEKAVALSAAKCEREGFDGLGGLI